ncbi:hypothetical protein CsSME_00020006 [Camellia sinensis var. sinensis]
MSMQLLTSLMGVAKAMTKVTENGIFIRWRTETTIPIFIGCRNQGRSIRRDRRKHSRTTTLLILHISKCFLERRSVSKHTTPNRIKLHIQTFQKLEDLHLFNKFSVTNRISGIDRLVVLKMIKSLLTIAKESKILEDRHLTLDGPVNRVSQLKSLREIAFVGMRSGHSLQISCVMSINKYPSLISGTIECINQSILRELVISY